MNIIKFYKHLLSKLILYLGGNTKKEEWPDIGMWSYGKIPPSV